MRLLPLLLAVAAVISAPAQPWVVFDTPEQSATDEVITESATVDGGGSVSEPVPAHNLRGHLTEPVPADSLAYLFVSPNPEDSTAILNFVQSVPPNDWAEQTMPWRPVVIPLSADGYFTYIVDSRRHPNAHLIVLVDVTGTKTAVHQLGGQ